MDKYISDQVLKWYERLEQTILEFAKHVPITAANENLQTPYLATTIIDACSLLDSVFRHMTPETVTVKGKQKKRDECNIEDFAQLHSNSLDLANTRSIMLVSPPSYRNPFKPWQNPTPGGRYIYLNWWKSYTGLKHDCLANLNQATLGVALDSLCALHQVLGRSIEMVPHLLRQGWFPVGNYTADYVLKDLDKQSLPAAFIVQTQLFAVPMGTVRGGSGENQFLEELNDLKLYHFVCKPNLLEFLPECL